MQDVTNVGVLNNNEMKLGEWKMKILLMLRSEVALMRTCGEK